MQHITCPIGDITIPRLHILQIHPQDVTVFKRKVTNYLKCLYCYFKNSDKLNDFHHVFTDNVCKIFEEFDWEMPDDVG